MKCLLGHLIFFVVLILIICELPFFSSVCFHWFYCILSLLVSTFHLTNSSCLQKTAKSGLHILLGGICALTVVVFFRFVSGYILIPLISDLLRLLSFHRKESNYANYQLHLPCPFLLIVRGKDVDIVFSYGPLLQGPCWVEYLFFEIWWGKLHGLVLLLTFANKNEKRSLMGLHSDEVDFSSERSYLNDGLESNSTSRQYPLIIIY